MNISHGTLTLNNLETKPILIINKLRYLDKFMEKEQKKSQTRVAGIEFHPDSLL